jgi:hypothetical protein
VLADLDTPPAIDDLDVTLPGADGPTLADGGAIGRPPECRFVANHDVAADESDARWIVAVPASAVDDCRASVEDLVLLLHYTVAEDLDA